MSVEKYWIGKGINYEKVWWDFDDGLSYIDKYRSMRVHLIQIELVQYPKDVPLFNFEAVYKTLKGYYHDLKQLCLSPEDYNSSGPLFLYSVERGSGVWSFVGELRHLLTYGTSLADQKIIGRKLDNMDKRLAILQKYFSGGAVPGDFQAFMKAQTPRELEIAMQRLIAQGVKRVQVSTKPFVGDVEATKASLVDLRNLLDEADQAPPATPIL